jgi:CRP-like cAMP-binding protein
MVPGLGYAEGRGSYGLDPEPPRTLFELRLMGVHEDLKCAHFTGSESRDGSYPMPRLADSDSEDEDRHALDREGNLARNEVLDEALRRRHEDMVDQMTVEGTDPHLQQRRTKGSWLYSTPLHGVLDTAAREKLLSRIELVEARTENTIMCQGRECPGLYLLVEGRVIVDVKPDGADVHAQHHGNDIKHTLGPGAWFPAHSLVAETTAPFTATAAAGAVLLFVSKEHFTRLVLPAVKASVAQELASVSRIFSSGSQVCRPVLRARRVQATM